MTVKKPHKKRKQTADMREAQELKRALKALEGSSHNPINWAAIIAFVAPIVARIAVRYVFRAIARKTGKKYSTSIRDETVVGAADFVSDIAVKRALKQ